MKPQRFFQKADQLRVSRTATLLRGSWLLYRTSRRKRLRGRHLCAEFLRRSCLTLNAFEHFLQSRDAAVHGDVAIYLEITVPHVVHIGVLPPVDLPGHVVEAV